MFTKNKNSNNITTNTNKKDKMITITKGSFIKRYGILAVPMIFMMCFGCFGFRPGQLTRGIGTCLINFFFFFTFALLIISLCNFAITTNDFGNLDANFMSLIFLAYLIYYILLLYKFYKKYNMYCLFEDVKNVRLNRLSNLESLKVFFLLFLCLLFVSYFLYMNATEIIHVSNNNFWNAVTMDPLWSKILMILHPFLSSILVSMSIVCLRFMTSVFAIVLAREFDQCNSDLKDTILNDKYLKHDTFKKVTKRFNELANMVDKVNEMACNLVVIPLVGALGALCNAIYSTILDPNEITSNMLEVCEAMLIVILLLPQAMLLNEKVICLLSFVKIFGGHHSFPYIPASSCFPSPTCMLCHPLPMKSADSPLVSSLLQESLSVHSPH